MQNEIVFDIETYGNIRDFNNLKVTVVSVYNYASDSYQSFTENNLADLWPVLERADRIIGYNSEHFDVPILNRLYPGDLSQIPHLDILKVIKETSGSRYKLDDIAKATLQISKSADGLAAQKWYEEGRIDDIIKYCEQDVKVTKEIYDYGRKNRMLYYSTLTGDLMPIAVNFEPKQAEQKQASSGMNMTLPI